MKAPKESLDDFIVIPPDPAEPPPPRSVRPTGRVRLLEPLARREDLAKRRGALAGPWVRRLSWFHRSLAVTGAVAVVAFLASSIYLGIYGPSFEQGVRSNEMGMSRQRKESTPPKDPGPFGPLPDEVSPQVSDETIVVPTVVRARPAGPRIQLAAYRTRHLARRRPKFVMSKFVPTTLVIYAENGEIKTRVEPQLTAGYKKPQTFPN